MKRTTAKNSVSGHPVDRNTTTGTTGSTWGKEDWDNHQEEIISPIEGLGLTLDGTKQNQLHKAIVGLSHVVGETLYMEFEKTAAEFFPAVPRNVNIDISLTNYPLLVPALRAVKTNILGTTDFAVTVSGSVVTIPDTAAGNKLINLLQAEALAAGYLNQSQPANFTADYSTSTTQRCINVGGTDYAISSVTVVSRQITVSGTPASGSQTACIYTYRVAGSAITARLLKISGFVGVAAGDVDGEVIGGWRKMDRGQGHMHGSNTTLGPLTTSGGTGGADVSIGGGHFYYNPPILTGSPTTDGSNGSPRTGKTTDPRTYGQYVYTWAGIYNA
jgi:hypothetical protein